MSRTRRRTLWTLFRCPRDNGARRAVMETLDGEVAPAFRARAIPPHAWLDRPFSREADKGALRYMKNARRDGHGFRYSIRRAARRYGLSYREAFEMLSSVAPRTV